VDVRTVSDPGTYPHAHIHSCACLAILRGLEQAQIVLLSKHTVIFYVCFFCSIVLPVLLSVAFFTILERKALGHSQNREGPEITGLAGLLQPFADGAKLFTKEVFISLKGNVFLFLVAPIISFSLSISL